MLTLMGYAKMTRTISPLLCGLMSRDVINTLPAIVVRKRTPHAVAARGGRVFSPDPAQGRLIQRFQWFRIRPLCVTFCKTRTTPTAEIVDCHSQPYVFRVPVLVPSNPRAPPFLGFLHLGLLDLKDGEPCARRRTGGWALSTRISPGASTKGSASLYPARSLRSTHLHFSRYNRSTNPIHAESLEHLP